MCGPSLGSSSVASNEIKLQNFRDRVKHKENVLHINTFLLILEVVYRMYLPWIPDKFLKEKSSGGGTSLFAWIAAKANGLDLLDMLASCDAFQVLRRKVNRGHYCFSWRLLLLSWQLTTEQKTKHGQRLTSYKQTWRAITKVFPCNYLFAHENIFIAVLNLCSLWEFSQEHFLRFIENVEFSLKSIYVRIFRYHCNCTCRTDNVHTDFPSLSTFLGHEPRLASPRLTSPHLAIFLDLHRNFLRWSFNNLQLFRRH